MCIWPTDATVVGQLRVGRLCNSCPFAKEKIPVTNGRTLKVDYPPSKYVVKAILFDGLFHYANQFNVFKVKRLFINVDKKHL